MNTLGDVVARMRGVAAVQSLGGLSDRELLGRFVGSNDDAAFSVLVERHGPMVLGVCRRALSRHDAEDACQAVFLVLARKAASLRKESLGCWLHGVARRVAANALRNAALRKAREAGAAPPAPRNPVEEASWREVLRTLDEELARLPERYRAPMVLCYLESLTRDEAALRLGTSPGTLHGCLERGRQMLRARLSKRGLSFPAVVTAATLGESAMPPMLAASTGHAAKLFAAGLPIPESVGTNVVALAKGVLMGTTKLQIYLAGVVCAALVLAGGSFLPMVSAQNDRQYRLAEAAPAKAPPARAEDDEAFLRRMSKDLRGTEPTPTEVHFFLANRDAGKRQRLIDLFIEERKARQTARDVEAEAEKTTLGLVKWAMWGKLRDDRQKMDEWLRAVEAVKKPADLNVIQKKFLERLKLAHTREDVAKATEAYLQGLMHHVKSHPDTQASPEVIRQIILILESQGKTLQAEVWRSSLPEKPKDEAPRRKSSDARPKQ